MKSIHRDLAKNLRTDRSDQGGRQDSGLRQPRRRRLGPSRRAEYASRSVLPPRADWELLHIDPLPDDVITVAWADNGIGRPMPHRKFWPEPRYFEAARTWSPSARDDGARSLNIASKACCTDDAEP